MLHIRCNRRSKTIEDPQNGLRLSVLHLHLDLPEIKDREPALKNERTFDDVQKAAGRLNIDSATIFTTVIHQ